MAKECGECGGAVKRKGADFCSPACRIDWNNRRKARGAEMYDLVMALRHERSKASDEHIWSVLSNLARAYKDADTVKRAGRASWDVDAALARIPLAYGSEGDGR